MDYTLIGCAALLLATLVVWAKLTNPFSRYTIVARPFSTDRDRDGYLRLHEQVRLQVRTGKLYSLLGLLKAGVHIVANPYVGSPKAPAGDEVGIIQAIHALRFHPDRPFLISGDHFSMLYPRSLGIFYHSLLDPRTALNADDWDRRQTIYLKTLAYGLAVFSQTTRLATTVVPLGRRTVTLADVYNPPSDTLYSLLYALDVMLSPQRLADIYPFAADTHYPLKTQRAARRLLTKYQLALQHHLQRYRALVYDETTGLLRADLCLSGTKDISYEYSGFYDNVMFWKTEQLAMRLGLISNDQPFLAVLKQRILRAFWLEAPGHFLEDLSAAAQAGQYYSSDWLIVLKTEFLRPDDPADRPYLERAVHYLQAEGIDRPFGVKYQQTDRVEREHFFDRHFVPDYGGTAIWSHWGMEYVKLLVRLYQVTGHAPYLDEAGRQLQAYAQNIERYQGYPELYHQTGALFSHLFYKSVRQTGWVVNYEQAKAAYNAVRQLQVVELETPAPPTPQAAAV